MTVLKGLDTRLKLAKLHLITDLRSKQGDLKDFLVAAISGGVDLVELRDPQASEDELVEALELARSVALQLDAGVIVGGSLGAAERFGADYLHLGAASGEVDRGGLSEFAIIGRSVHNADQMRAANDEDAIGWMLVGPVYGPAKLKLDGPELVRRAAEIAPVGEGKPWFAVGSINEKNLAEVVEAGALRVSVSAAITGAKDPKAAAERIKAVLQQAWDARPELEKYSLKAAGTGTAHLLGATLAPAAGETDEAPAADEAQEPVTQEANEAPEAEVAPEAPVEEAPVQESGPAEAPVEAPVDETAPEAPVEEAPAAPIDSVPVDTAAHARAEEPAAETAPITEVPVEVATDEARAQEPSEELPAEPVTGEVPVEAVPADDAPAEDAPAEEPREDAPAEQDVPAEDDSTAGQDELPVEPKYDQE